MVARSTGWVKSNAGEPQRNIYIYIHTYIYIHIYIYIHMYIHNESDRRIVCIYTYVRSHFLSKLTHRSGGTIRKGRTSPSTTIHTKKTRTTILNSGQNMFCSFCFSHCVFLGTLTQAQRGDLLLIPCLRSRGEPTNHRHTDKPTHNTVSPRGDRRSKTPVRESKRAHTIEALPWKIPPPWRTDHYKKSSKLWTTTQTRSFAFAAPNSCASSAPVLCSCCRRRSCCARPLFGDIVCPLPLGGLVAAAAGDAVPIPYFK